MKTLATILVDEDWVWNCFGYKPEDLVDDESLSYICGWYWGDFKKISRDQFLLMPWSNFINIDFALQGFNDAVGSLEDDLCC